MQSSDAPTVDVCRTGDDNFDSDVLDAQTLPQLSNDVIVGNSGDSLFHESNAGVSGEVLNRVGGVEGGNLEGEEVNEDMEVDFVENNGVLEGSENLVVGRESNCLEGEKGSDNQKESGVEDSDSRAILVQSEYSEACAVEEGKGCTTSKTVVEGVDDQESSGKASFNSFEQQLFSKLVTDDGFHKHVMLAGIDGSLAVSGNVVEVNKTSSVVEIQEKQAIRSKTDAVKSDKENIGINVTEGGSFDSKGELEILSVGSDSDVTGSNKVTGVTHVSEGGGTSVPKEVGLDPCVISHGKKSTKKGGFCTSDLVWGKVRSHPWWPAQVFEPGDASEQAKKHFRSKSYLVAYFGDQSFAWNEEAKLKPFAPHFSKMAKQSTAEAFRDAVSCAVDEAARRVEFGLSCHCIAEDVTSRLKIQVIENAGIREESSIRECRDRLDTASTFEPVKFLDYVKRLAQVPHVEDNIRLEQAVAQAQMSAFYRWKGCYHLAEFGSLIGYVNNEADAPVSREKDEMHQIISDATVFPPGKMNEDDVRPQKRKNLSGGDSNSSKKMKCLSDSMSRKGKKDVSKEDDGDETEGKHRESASSSVQRRRKAISSLSKSKESSPQITPARESKSDLRVGKSILRAALQLSQPSPLLKLDVSSHGKTTKGNGKSKQSHGQTEATPFKNSSSDAILSKFLLAALDPLNKHSFLSSMIDFFSDFRDSVVEKIEFLVKHGEPESYDIVCKSKERPGSGPEEIVEPKSKKNGSDCDITTSSDIKGLEDACCAGKITKVPEELQASLSDQEMAPVEPQLVKPYGNSPALLEINSSVSGSQPQSVSEKVASEGGVSNEDTLPEESTTALTLKFTDMDSIPTEDKLNKIFSAFGALKESETEVLAKKNCARVVFKRRLDAETAFSSSGKFETFGASLVCYQLNYAPSPRKSSGSEAKRRRKDGTLVEGIAT